MSSIETQDYNIISLVASSFSLQNTASNSANNNVNGANNNPNQIQQSFSDLLQQVSLGSNVKRQDNLFSNFNQSLQTKPIEYKQEQPVTEQAPRQDNEQKPPQQADKVERDSEPPKETEETSPEQDNNQQQEQTNRPDKKPEQGQQNNDDDDGLAQELKTVLGQLGIQLSTQELNALTAAISQLREGESGEQFGQLLNFLRHNVTQEVSGIPAELQQLANNIKDTLVKIGNDILSKNNTHVTIDGTNIAQQQHNNQQTQQNIVTVTTDNNNDNVTQQLNISQHNQQNTKQQQHDIVNPNQHHVINKDTTQQHHVIDDVEIGDNVQHIVKDNSNITKQQNDGKQVEVNKDVVTVKQHDTSTSTQQAINTNNTKQQQTTQHDDNTAQIDTNNRDNISDIRHDVSRDILNNIKSEQISWRLDGGADLNAEQTQKVDIFQGSLLLQNLAVQQLQNTSSNTGAQLNTHDPYKTDISNQQPGVETSLSNRDNTSSNHHDIFRPIINSTPIVADGADDARPRIQENFIESTRAQQALNPRSISGGGSEQPTADKNFNQQPQQQNESQAADTKQKPEQASRNQEQAEQLKAQREKYQKALNQITQSLQKAIANGEETIALQLQPKELGKVQAAITFIAETTVNVKFSAEKIDTIDALRDDKKTLSSLLQDLGYECDEDCFEFTQHDGTHKNNDEFQGEFASFLDDDTDNNFQDALVNNEEKQNNYLDGWVLAQSLLNSIEINDDGHIDIQI